MNKVTIYDTTLRDGTQGEGVSLSLQDKLDIARRLDDLGVHYIEAGYPVSNEKDEAVFRDLKRYPLKHAVAVAFGMTRRVGAKAAEDADAGGAPGGRDAGRGPRRQGVGFPRDEGPADRPWKRTWR